MQPRLALLLPGRSVRPAGRSLYVIRPDLSNQCLAEAALGNHWLDFAMGAGGGFSESVPSLSRSLAKSRSGTSRRISGHRGRPESIVAIVYNL